ncbi:MAG: hypothetical protein QM803_08885 [Rhodocyclaceae bacterium]
MDYKQRPIVLEEGGRTNLRLTADEWREVEEVADATGLRWADWVRTALKVAPHVPRTEAIRKALRAHRAAMREGSAFDEGAYEHPYIKASRFGDAKDMELIRADFEQQWAIDCGGFVARFGYNRQNGPDDVMIYIDNQLKTGMDMAFARSFDLEPE